jgi:hypothetical protein
MHTVKHDLRGKLWCGPAAISAITGRGTRTVRDAVQWHRGNYRPVSSTKPSEVLAALELLGYGFQEVWNCEKSYFGKPTLVQFVRHWRDELACGLPILCALTGHFVVLQGDLFVDSWTKTPVPFSDAPKQFRRRRVAYAWRIFQRT